MEGGRRNKYTQYVVWPPRAYHQQDGSSIENRQVRNSGVLRCQCSELKHDNQ